MQIGKWLLINMLLVLCPFLINGQIDTSYIESTIDSKSAALLATVKSFKVSFNSEVAEQQTFHNTNLGPGIELRYKTIGLALSLPLVSITKSEFGTPTSIGAGFNLFPRSFFFQGELLYMHGFEDLNALFNNLGQVFRQDDKMIYGNFTSMYAFNSSKFSIRSALKFINIQRRSAGSFLLAVPISFQYFETDRIILPLENQPDFQLDVFRSLKVGLAGGYAYSLVRGKWCGTIMAVAGPEFRNIFYRNALSDRLENKVEMNPSLRITGSLIRDHRNHFYGIIGQFITERESADRFHSQVENWWIRATIGRRFFPEKK